MPRSKKIGLILACGAFALLSGFLASGEAWWCFLTPIALLLVILFIVDFPVFWKICIVTVPFSVFLEVESLGGLGVSLPAEPLLAVISLFVILSLPLKWKAYLSILRHPITIWIILYLAWLLICIPFSTHPIVSVKYWIARFWFILPAYLVSLMMLRHKMISPSGLLKLYLIPFCLIVLYAMYNHAQLGFGEQRSFSIMIPFYNDHTQFGAVYALLIPLAIHLFGNSRGLEKWLYLGVSILFLAGIYLTFSRASIVSLLAGFCFYVIVKSRISWKWLASLFIPVLVIGLISLNAILAKLDENQTDSSDNAIENLESVTNISTDASNVERLNRWLCAIDMFKEKPIFGWGPGVYKFEYAPFQRSDYLTIISTNVGDVGNAHSEYLGPLAETGLVGMILVICLFLSIMIYGLKVYRGHGDLSTRGLILSILVGLSTYFVHGLLNNFLDTDEVAVLFWCMVAVIVHCDLKYRKVFNKATEQGNLQQHCT